MSIHHEPMKCLAKGIQLARSDDVDSLRYACLQLRMAIEHLFYELIPLYKDELPTEVFDQWQPQRILDAVIECNPDATQDLQIAIQAGEIETFLNLGTQTAVTKKMLRAHYQRLGSFLHAPQYGKPLQFDKLRSAVDEAAKDLERFRSDRIMGNIAAYIAFHCERCNHPFKRRSQAIPENKRVRCLNGKCAALHRLELNADGSFQVELATRGFRCMHCDAENTIDEPDCRHGHRVDCISCGKTHEVSEIVTIRLLDPAAS